jgi:hypothetical protein
MRLSCSRERFSQRLHDDLEVALDRFAQRRYRWTIIDRLFVLRRGAVLHETGRLLLLPRQRAIIESAVIQEGGGGTLSFSLI